jgi:hypothetical protein
MGFNAPDDAEVVLFLFGACESTFDAAFVKYEQAAKAYPSARFLLVADDPDVLLPVFKEIVPSTGWLCKRHQFGLAALTSRFEGKATAIIRADYFWSGGPPSPDDGGGFIWFTDTDEVYVAGNCHATNQTLGESPFLVPSRKRFRDLRRLPRASGNVSATKTSLRRLVAVWEGSEYDRYRERVVLESISAKAEDVEKNREAVVERLSRFANLLNGRTLAVSGCDGAAFEHRIS